MRQGRLYINAKMVKRKRIEDFLLTDEFGRQRRIPQFVETLPGGFSHRILELTDQGSLDDTLEYVVPPDHFFTMGDNRDNSLDSRVPGGQGVGFVPADNLVGRAEVIFFSTDGSAHLWEFWRWPQATRFSRFFQSVD